MARLYADEQFPLRIVEILRAFGHDVLTVQEAGKAGLKIPDEEVLAFAVNQKRAVLTLNRRDFIRLHQTEPSHAGILVCTDDEDREEVASRINQAIANTKTLTGQLIRVVRPQR